MVDLQFYVSHHINVQHIERNNVDTHRELNQLIVHVFELYEEAREPGDLTHTHATQFFFTMGGTPHSKKNNQ